PVVWATLLPLHSEPVRQQADAVFQLQLIHQIQSGHGALYPNAIRTLTALKEQGFTLFIASNGLEPYLQSIVAYYNLDQWMTETWSIARVASLHKSDLVRAIVETYNIAEGAVVGDRLSDIQAAKDNNLLAVGCRFDFAKPEELQYADVIVDDLLELVNFATNNLQKTS
ncbi:MAG: HAD family hydrolase, partial [Bacilli bacterium]